MLDPKNYTKEALWQRFVEVFVLGGAPRAADDGGCVYGDAEHGGVGRGCAIGCQIGFQDLTAEILEEKGLEPDIDGNYYGRFWDAFDLPEESRQFAGHLQMFHDAAQNWNQDGTISKRAVQKFAREHNVNA